MSDLSTLPPLLLPSPRQVTLTGGTTRATEPVEVGDSLIDPGAGARHQRRRRAAPQIAPLVGLTLYLAAKEGSLQTRFRRERRAAGGDCGHAIFPTGLPRETRRGVEDCDEWGKDAAARERQRFGRVRERAGEAYSSSLTAESVSSARTRGATYAGGAC